MANDKVEIAIIDLDGHVFISYKSNVVPRKGEIVYFSHFGAFRVISVVHDISDDAPNKDDNSLLFVSIIIDRRKPLSTDEQITETTM